MNISIMDCKIPRYLPNFTDFGILTCFKRFQPFILIMETWSNFENLLIYQQLSNINQS